MKKQSLLLITGGILAFASCSPDTSGNAEEMQAKVDSIVNARVEQIRLELQEKNDEYIMEMAIYRADSIMAIKTGKKVVAKKPKAPVVESTGSASTTNPVEEKKPETVGNGKPKMGNNDPNTVGNGKPKMGNNNSNEVGNGKPKMGGN